MRLLRQIDGFLQRISRDRKLHYSARRRALPIALESLENRTVMSIAGVTLAYGNLSIQAPAGSSHNVAKVWIDSSTHNIAVSLNGKSEEFNPKLVCNTTYMGGSGGKDTFTDDTSLCSLEYGLGSGNNFTGGTGFNYVYFFGGGNTYNTQTRSVNDIFEIGGSDTIDNPSKAEMQVFVYG